MPSDLFFPQEAISKAVPIIEPSHAVTHDGTHFTLTYTESVGTGTAVTILLHTPVAANNKYIHFTCAVEADKAVDWEFSEAPGASGGSVLTALNNNRNSINTNPVTITKAVTFASSGTILESHIMGTNEPTTKLGGNAEARNEWLLAPDTYYLIRAVAIASGTKINIVIPFYYRGA